MARLAKILPQCAAATQDRIPVALINGKNLSVKPTNLKVDDEARLDRSMPPSAPPPLACQTSYRRCPYARIMATFGTRGNQACGATVDEDAVSEKSIPSLEDEATRRLSSRSRKKSWVGRPASIFNKLLAAGRRKRALEDVGKEIPTESTETHSNAEGTKVIVRGLTAQQYNGLVGKIWKNCTTASTHGRIPWALMNGHKLSVQITNLEIAPTDQSSSPKNHAGRTQYTRTTDCETTEVEFQERIKQGTNGEEDVKLDNTQSEDSDGGHLLEGDGWHTDEIHEAVCTWCEMGVLESQCTDCVQHRALGSDISYPAIHRRLPSRRGRRRHGGSETEPPLDAVPPVMGVLHDRSDVAHTDPSLVGVDCGICHAHYCE